MNGPTNKNSYTPSRINTLLEEIREREEELELAIRKCETKFFYKLEGTKIKFEESIEEAHRHIKVNILTWIGNSSLRNTVTAPVIYLMIIPFFLLDISVSIYQFLCFPAYGIKKINRKKYIVIDRYHLSYLNGIEKLNCLYCGYVNGLIAYSREIVSCTEQYWCPIKHARKILQPHRRYAKFADFGDHEKYHAHLKEMRKSLQNNKSA